MTSELICLCERAVFLALYNARLFDHSLLSIAGTGLLLWRWSVIASDVVLAQARAISQKEQRTTRVPVIRDRGRHAGLTISFRRVLVRCSSST